MENQDHARFCQKCGHAISLDKAIPNEEKIDIVQETSFSVDEDKLLGAQFARVAYITNITPGHSEISIQYAVDNSILPISNAELEGYAVELSLGRHCSRHIC
jgi:hypothetical protein